MSTPGIHDDETPDTSGATGPPPTRQWGWHIRAPRWTRHTGVRQPSELTLGERSADLLRNKMGSWGFVLFAVVFLAVWMLYNRDVGFDKYPFILLNLVLSCLAALQGAIILIAAKREDQIASELAHHDYETNLESERMIREIHELTVAMHRMLTSGGGGSVNRLGVDGKPGDQPQ